MADLSGRSIGGFRIGRELLKGAQGRVYTAVCESDVFPGCPCGTNVVLKTMPSADDTGESFRRLAERTALLAAVNHPNIVRYFGCFRMQEAFGDLHAVVVERLEGETLKTRLQRETGGLDADLAVRVLEGMVRGLGAAAAAGVCHRDVKPGNLFLCRDGTVKIIDFESARIRTAGGVTSSEHMAGSFDYMAPEFTDPSFAGDEQSDVFSAGVVAHEMLTGILPYRKTPADVGQGSQPADFAFLERWSRTQDSGFGMRPIVVSARIRRLLAHTDRLFSGALSPDRDGRFKGFAEMLESVKAIRFRELKSEDRAYRMLQLVGKGGFGEVFKARLRATGQTVAIKHLLNSDYADRFYREAKIMAQLDDPCFVKFIDFMVVDKAGNKDAFLVMDFLPGMPGNSLKDAIRRSTDGLPRKDVLVAFVRYAHGLKVLHSRGIYHRDIKPANLYYPKGKPEESAIMDLGIARDVHGTVTTGNVPGTFDYMAPEIVSEGSRGGSGTDIYALGLCLYEALTGKTGYPRLPKGYAAYAQFFRRAKNLEPPVFDDPVVAGDGALLELLEAMTEPDAARRIVDIGEVERRIESLSKETGGPDDSVYDAATVTVTATVGRSPPSPTTRRASPHSGKKSRPPPRPSHPAAGPGKQSRPRAPFPTVRAFRAVAAVLLMALIGMGAYFYGPAALDQCRTAVRLSMERWRLYKDEKAALAEKERIGMLVVAAENEAMRIVERYASPHANTNELDRVCAEWDDKWSGKIPDAEIVRFRSSIQEARKNRECAGERQREFIGRMQEMQSEADSVVKAYGEDDIARGDALRADWDNRWRRNSSLYDISSKVSEISQSRTEAAERIRVKELVSRAKVAAERVNAEYDSSGSAVGDGMLARWKDDWGAKLPLSERKRLEALIEARRRNAVAREYEAAQKSNRERVLAECRELCEAVEPVEQRASRLQYAELRIRRAFRAGLIDSSTQEDFLAKIESLRKTQVVRIANKSGRDFSVAGRLLPNGGHEVLVFTNGIPKGLAATSRGYKPIEIRDWMNGRTLNITPDHLDADRVEVKMADPGPGIVCRVDGAPVNHGVVRLLPGTHECTYSRAGFETQSFPFQVEIATPMQIPPPSAWKAR